MRPTRLNNNISLYCCSMGKVFRVTHVCTDADESNATMAANPDTTLIAIDNNGLHYLALMHGAIAPSAILTDHQSHIR